MKIAVTGVSGYLGRLIVERLESDPEIESILGLDINPPSFESAKLTFQKADVLTSDFEKLLAGQDAVYHLAFIVEPRKGVDPLVFDKVNVGGSIRVFEGAERAGVKRVVYASSISAYGAHPDNPEPITEDLGRRPNQDWYYSRAKGKVEEFLDRFTAKHPEIIVIRLRPCLFVGPNVDNSLGAMFYAKRLTSYKSGTSANYMWDQDVAEAFRLALYHDHSDSFNIAGDDTLTTDQLGEMIGKKVIHLNHWVSVQVAKLLRLLGVISKGEFEWLKVGFSASIIVSSEKAKQKLGWQPRFDSVGAVREAIKHISQRQG